MHGGRKRSFGRGSCRKRFLPRAILYHGRQQIRGKEPPWPISRCALARTCSSFRRRFRRPCVGPVSSRRAIRRSRCWWSRKPSKKLTAWKRWPARSVWSPPWPISRRRAWWPLVPRAKARRWPRRPLRSWRSSSPSIRSWRSRPAVCRWIPTPRRRLWKIVTSTLVRRNCSMAALSTRSF